MIQLVTYLTFNGNCKEAMEFYQECLGGDLYLQTLGESPKIEKLPQHMKSYIVQATLKRENLTLMGTDMADEELLRGNSVSILLDCNDEDRIKTYYRKLQKDGKPTHPLKKTHWGKLFGELTDKYGNHWLFNCNRKP